MHSELSRTDRPGLEVPQRILVVEGTGHLINSAHEQGVDVVLVHDRSAVAVAEASVASAVVPVDLFDPNAMHAVLAPMHAERPFGRVISLTEKGLIPAAQIREMLGVPGNPATVVQLLKDKKRMRASLALRGLSPVATCSPENSGDLQEFFRRVGGPVILKPSDGVGSRAIYRIGTADEAADAWNSFLQTSSSPALAEEMLVGPEVSVEALTIAGSHHILAVTDKDIDDHFVESGHTMPSRLPERDVEAIRRLVSAFLGAVGVVEGPTHTEVKLTSNGPRIIESHDRIGGDRIRVLLELSLGIDLPGLVVNAAFKDGRLPELPATPRGAAIRFLSARPGTVTAVTAPVVQAPCQVSVTTGIGEQIRAIRRSSDRPGFVIADGDSADDAARTADALRAAVSITTVAAHEEDV